MAWNFIPDRWNRIHTLQVDTPGAARYVPIVDPEYTRVTAELIREESGAFVGW